METIVTYCKKEKLELEFDFGKTTDDLVQKFGEDFLVEAAKAHIKGILRTNMANLHARGKDISGLKGWRPKKVTQEEVLTKSIIDDFNKLDENGKARLIDKLTA